MSDADGPVVGDRPARVVRDFPHVAIGVGEGSGHAAPLGACRRPHDLPAGLLSLGKYCSDLIWGSNIVRKLYAGCAVAPKCRPEFQNHTASLKEADLLVRLLCAVPAHRLIKGSGPVQIGDAKGYQTDALLHLARITVQHNIRELCRPLYALAWAPSCYPTGQRTWRYGQGVGRGLVPIRWLSGRPDPAHPRGTSVAASSDTTVLVTEISPARFGPPMPGGE